MLPQELIHKVRDNFGRLAFTRYAELPGYEGELVENMYLGASAFFELLKAVGPFVFPMLVLFVRSWSLIHWGLAAWSLSELQIYVAHQRAMPALGKRPDFKISLDARYKFARSLLENLGDSSATAQELVASWIVGDEKATEAHLVQWILLLVFDKSALQLTEEEIPYARKIVEGFRRKLQLPPAQGGQAIRLYSPGIDPVRIVRKPAFFYLCTSVFQYTFGHYLGMVGFHFKCLKGSKHPFWVRFGKGSETPLVFVVGVGAGFMAYGNFIRHLISAYPTRTIVLLELPYVSLVHLAPIATFNDALKDVDDMVACLGFSQCSWMSHSYGSIMLSWVINSRPHLVKRATFVDPVNFRIWDASLTKFILYSPPKSYAAHFLNGFVATEPNIAHALTTHAMWLLNIIFPEDLTMPTNIFLSSHETLYDVKGCMAYLHDRLAANRQKNVIVSQMDTNHGGFQFSAKCTHSIISVL